MNRFWKGVIVLLIIPLVVAVAGGLLVEWWKSRDSGQPETTSRPEARRDETTSKRETDKPINLLLKKDGRNGDSPQVRIDQLQSQIDRFNRVVEQVKLANIKREGETKKLRNELEMVRKKVQLRKEELAALSHDLAADTGKEVRIGGEKVTQEDAKRIFLRWSKEFQDEEKLLKVGEELLGEREEADKADQGRLNTMLAKKTKLELEINTLRTAVAAQQSGAAIADIDDTPFRNLESVTKLFEMAEKEADLKGHPASDPDTVKTVEDWEKLRKKIEGAKPARDY